MNDATPPAAELFVTHFLVVSDQDRSCDFYQWSARQGVARGRAGRRAAMMRLTSAASAVFADADSQVIPADAQRGGLSYHSIPARIPKTALSLRNPSARPTGRKTRARR